MNVHSDIAAFIEAGTITSELDLERAMIADRKLRLLSKESVHFKNLRKKLRDLIEAYENQEWSNAAVITQEKLAESYHAERIAEQERQFQERRKHKIRTRIKALDLTQENLGSPLSGMLAQRIPDHK